MRLFLNGQPADLLENTEITSQLNSPYTDFKIVGDKSYSYTLPSSDRNRAIVGYANHRQAAELPKDLVSSLQEGGIEIIRGKARLRRGGDNALTLDCVVPPGNIPAGFWNMKLRKLDLGVDKLPTTHKFSDIYTLLETDTGYNTSNAADQRSFKSIFLSVGTTIRLKVGSAVLLEHTFSALGGLSETYKDNALGDFLNKIDTYNFAPSIAGTEIHYVDGTLNLIGKFDFVVLKIKPTVEIQFARERGTPSETIVFDKLKRLEYDDVSYDLQLARLQHKNYFFPTISAPNYYNDKNSDYNGFVNYKESGELKLSDDYNRTTYPLTPAFRFRFVFERLMVLMGYEMYVDFWEEWEDLAFCSFRDLAQQHPDTKLPFNIYPTEIRYADYMPDWTVADFFNEFGLLTCSSFDFAIADRTMRIEQLNKLFESTPFVFEGTAKVLDQDFEDAKQYQLGYSSKLESELESEEIKKFFQDYPEEAQERTKLSLKFLPLVPTAEQKITINLPRPRRNSGWNGDGQDLTNVESYHVFCHTVAQSVLFELTGENPTPRVFFYDTENRKALIETAAKSLSRNSPKGQSGLWAKVLEARKGKMLILDAQMAAIQFANVRFLVPFQYKNINYLIRQVTVKIKNKRAYHKVQLQLEQIS